jgi:hypothetical protein
VPSAQYCVPIQLLDHDGDQDAKKNSNYGCERNHQAKGPHFDTEHKASDVGDHSPGDGTHDRARVAAPERLQRRPPNRTRQR